MLASEGQTAGEICRVKIAAAVTVVPPLGGESDRDPLRKVSEGLRPSSRQRGIPGREASRRGGWSNLARACVAVYARRDESIKGTWLDCVYRK